MSFMSLYILMSNEIIHTSENAVDSSVVEVLQAQNFIEKAELYVQNDVKIVEQSTSDYVVYVDDKITFRMNSLHDAQYFLDLINEAKILSEAGNDVKEGLALLKLEYDVKKNKDNSPELKEYDISLAAELLDGTLLKEKVGDKFDIIAQKIDTTMMKYLTSLFGEAFVLQHPEIKEMFEHMSAGIQFSMLEALSGMESEDATQSFFDGFANINFK